MVYLKIFKPLIDRIGALVLFLILSPIFVLVMLLLAIFQNGNVFFVQPRPGKSERIFKVIKFKTMKEVYDHKGRLLPDDQRITAIGAFVRKTSLDEIPQLINIIKGEMSFIGPRPWLTEYLELYSDEQRKRHLVNPGITGWAQVNGRNALSWDKRFEYDLFYVRNVSLWLDLKIIYLTIIKVFKAEGISSVNHATMEKFKGN